jgi:hypothetical protein
VEIYPLQKEFFVNFFNLKKASLMIGIFITTACLSIEATQNDQRPVIVKKHKQDKRYQQPRTTKQRKQNKSFVKKNSPKSAK